MDTRSHTSVVYLQTLTTFVLIFLVTSGCQTPFVNSFLTTVSTEDLEEQFSGVSARMNRRRRTPVLATIYFLDRNLCGTHPAPAQGIRLPASARMQQGTR